MEAVSRDNPEPPLRQTITQYAGSNLVRQILGMVTAFARSRLLAPEQFGLWSLLNLIPQYSGFLHLGARSGITYRIPSLQHQGDADGAALVRNTVRRFSFTTSLLAALALLGAALWFHQQPRLSLLLVLSAILVMVNWWFEHRLVLLKGEQCFDQISRCNYLRAVLLLFATLVLVPLWGVAGALLSVALSLTVGAIYLIRRSPPLQHTGFDAHLLGSMIRRGAPLLGVSLVTLLMRNADRLMIATMLNLHAVGLYALGGMIVGFMINVPGVSREVLEPRLMQALHKRPLDELIGPYLVEPVFKSALLMPLLLIPLELTLPWFIHRFLPQYVDGISAIRILLLSSFLMALFYPLRGIVVARDWQGRTLLHASLALAVNVAGDWYVLNAGLGLAAVALVSVAAFFLLLCLEWFTVMARLPHPTEMLPGQRSLVWVIALVSAWVLPRILINTTDQAANTTDPQPLLALLGFLIIYVPVVKYLYRRPRNRQLMQGEGR